MIERVRVVTVTANASGDSSVLRAREVLPVLVGPTQRWWYAWGAEDVSDPGDALEPYVVRSHFPAPGGVRVMVARFPAGEIFLDEPAVSEAERAGSARVRALLAAEPAGLTALADQPAMHRTATFDLAFVAEGQLELHTSDGEIERLGPGDVYVNDGALHAWRSSPEGATVVFTIFGIAR